MAKRIKADKPKAPLFFIVDERLKAKPIYTQPLTTQPFPRTFPSLELTNAFIHELKKLYRNPNIINERNTTTARLEDKVHSDALTNELTTKQLKQSLQEANNVISIYKKKSQFTSCKRLAYQATIALLVLIISLLLWI